MLFSAERSQPVAPRRTANSRDRKGHRVTAGTHRRPSAFTSTTGSPSRSVPRRFRVAPPRRCISGILSDANWESWERTDPDRRLEALPKNRVARRSWWAMVGAMAPAPPRPARGLAYRSRPAQTGSAPADLQGDAGRAFSTRGREVLRSGRTREGRGPRCAVPGAALVPRWPRLFSSGPPGQSVAPRPTSHKYSLPWFSAMPNLDKDQLWEREAERIPKHWPSFVSAPTL